MLLFTKITEKQISAYADHLELRERAPATISMYASQVNEFSEFLSGRPVTKANLLAWKKKLLEDHLSPVTVNTKIAAVNAYVRWKKHPELVLKYETVERPMFRSESRNLTLEDYRLLVSKAQEKGDARKALLLMTLCETGIRISELQYITVEAARAGRAEVSMKGKNRTIVISHNLSRRLLDYAESRNIRSGQIFLTSAGNPLGRKAVWAELKSLSRAAGVESTKVYPHNFRHLFATLHYEKYHDFALLANTLGHSSIETTRIYLSSTVSDAMEKIEALGIVD